MADNEAKARQKMAEGRKKLSGGGGFFSKVFGGGGGSSEAADLFIQGGEMDEEDNDAYEAENSEIECGHQGCEFIASNLLEFEQHYAQHSFQCSECGAAFDTAHRLEVHQDERHNPFFEIQVARQSEFSHFRCLHPTCEIRFTNSRTRDEHARVVHLICGETSRRRKTDDNGLLNVLGSAMSRMSVKSGDVEETGWTGERQQGLAPNVRRNVKKATRRTKN